MSVSSNDPRLPERYRLVALIGEGSMGAVSHVHDRLTGQDVALKQVLLPSNFPPDEIERELLTLAHEFRVLAGLRHPNIISVLDYGFDGARQPFYTTDLLHDGTTILSAGQMLPLVGKVDLLLQALEALAYLHRRGVLHHDLKPANMLVADGRVRLLDFGLVVLASQQRDNDAFGTLQYLAPEVLDRAPYTESADLYSLGVIAYELLVGQHPFVAETVQRFLKQVFSAPPDLSALADTPALAQVLGQLLDKDPAARPDSARAVIAALRGAVGLQEQAGDVAIRESYLQAAAFVGREQELSQLAAALGPACSMVTSRAGRLGWAAPKHTLPRAPKWPGASTPSLRKIWRQRRGRRGWQGVGRSQRRVCRCCSKGWRRARPMWNSCSARWMWTKHTVDRPAPTMPWALGQGATCSGRPACLPASPPPVLPCCARVAVRVSVYLRGWPCARWPNG
jgi:hypothetical protein